VLYDVGFVLCVVDVYEVCKEFEVKGVEFYGEVFDIGVCYMVFFVDFDGN